MFVRYKPQKTCDVKEKMDPVIPGRIGRGIRKTGVELKAVTILLRAAKGRDGLAVNGTDKTPPEGDGQ
jgi:hypothetical protein